jgi:PBP1b-binding outer membrane lipoprotein LpoB
MKKIMYPVAFVALFVAACSGNNSESQTGTSRAEVQTVDNQALVADSLSREKEAVQMEIELAAHELDSLLNEIQ